MGKEALLSTDSSASLSGGTEQSHRNPRDHRSNFSKAHRTMFRTGTTPGEHLLPCKSWVFPLVSHSSYRSWDVKPRTLLALNSQALEAVSSDSS